MKIGIVSGYYNCLHEGHIDYISFSRLQCDFLITIVNNDIQVDLKGSKKFMNETHRCKIMSALRDVNLVILSIDKDKTVCETIKLIRNRFPFEELLFFNSGDRISNNIDSSEVILCRELNIKYVEINLPKIYSSSELLKNI